MLRFLVLVSFAALALAQLVPEPRYLEDVSTEDRIVGGEVANANSWPWRASIEYLIEGSWLNICTGVLIKRGWVLTAAQCVDSELTSRVVLGDHDLSNHVGTEQYINVSRVYTHPNWIINNYPEYDIALLRLSYDASLNNYVQLGVLPPSGQVLPNNNPCYLSGWFYNSEGQLSAKLKQVYLPVVDHTCSSSYFFSTPVKISVVCADCSDTGCQDIGYGPLNCSVDGQWVVHGLTSFWSDKKVFFTRVSDYISWMNSIMS